MSNFSSDYEQTAVLRTPAAEQPTVHFAQVARGYMMSKPWITAQNVADIPIFEPTKVIAGIIYGPGDVVVPDATVKLVRQADDRVVAISTTDMSGQYSFTRDEDDFALYYAIAYTAATTPQVHGTSDRGMVAL